MAYEIHAGKSIAFQTIALRYIAGRPILAEPIDPMWGGLSVPQWISLFYDTHAPNGMGGMVRIEWPEPGGLAEQPDVVVRAFGVVASQIYAASESINRQQRDSGS